MEAKDFRNDEVTCVALTEGGLRRRVTLALPLAAAVSCAQTLLLAALGVCFGPGLTDTVRPLHVLVVTAV